MSRNSPENSPRSRQLHDQALGVLPGGVSRNTVYRHPFPHYAGRGEGCRVTDLDGNSRIDFANNMASLIHGHACVPIIDAVVNQLKCGTAFSMATEAELLLARLLCDRVPSIDQIRFTNSGTEAVMAAIKAARAITGRPGIAKCEGAYHGTYDFAEVSQSPTPDDWGDPAAPLSVPLAHGTPESVLQDVLVIPFNDTERTIALLDSRKHQLAAVIIDPLPHRIGLIRALPEYVRALREWTTDHGVLLIFDEVISFRMEYAGAAAWYDVQPDLTTLGKIIGGGFPVGAVAGTRATMEVFDPGRPPLRFPWSGTFSANPVSMTAGRVAMELYDQAAVSRLNRLGQLARQRIQTLLLETGTSACVTGAGSMFRIHPQRDPPTGYRSTWQSPPQQAWTAGFVQRMFDQGIMLFRTGTGALSTAMTESEIEQLVEACRHSLP